MNCKDCITYPICKADFIDKVYKKCHELNLYGIYNLVIVEKCKINNIKKLIDIMNYRYAPELFNKIIKEIEDTFDIRVEYIFKGDKTWTETIHVKSV